MTSAVLYQCALFVGSLLLVTLASYLLTSSLEKTGARLGLTESLLGIVTALGANAPEIASAIIALAAGHHELGVGVVLGSNIFNLAALLGLSALLAGAVRPGKEGLWLDGGVAILATLVGTALICGFLVPWVSALILGLLLAPYVWLSSLYPRHIQNMKLPEHVRGFLTRALTDVRDDSKRDVTSPKASRLEMLEMIPCLFTIVVGSQGVIHSTVSLAGHYHLPHAVVGMLVMAALTGIPNVIAAVHLAMRGRGAAVVTESFNSNTLNIVAGICLPSLIVGLGKVSRSTSLALWWLPGMTAAAIILSARRGGLRRTGGVILILLYAGFVALTILRG